MRSSSHAKLAQYRHTRSHGRRHGGRGAGASYGRAAGQLARRYVLAIGALTATSVVAPALALILYPTMGIWLARETGARITWSEHHATIEAVARAKLQMVLTWPAALPPLIARLWIAHAL